MIAESAMVGEALNLRQKALAQNEEDLLDTAVREHARLVYRIAYSVLRNPSDAEDATQEVFLRVLRYGKKMSGIDDQKAWLARIAWRVAVDSAQEHGQVGRRDRRSWRDAGSARPRSGSSFAGAGA